ncbi:hypothetical protein A2U01_0080394, partial [Trifolium medium]|nr:hypothetical protein [Trifolium medium]
SKTNVASNTSSMLPLLKAKEESGVSYYHSKNDLTRFLALHNYQYQLYALSR